MLLPQRPCMYVQNQYNFLSFFPFYSLLFVQGRMTRMVQTPFCLFVFVFLIAYGQSFSTQQISSATNIQETSNELVGLLLSPKEKRDKQKIQDLVKELVEAKVTVDLNKCLDGSLYFSNVIEGPTPLWERFGFFSGNIQGQQYTFNDKEMSVINYAELLGDGKVLASFTTLECYIYIYSLTLLSFSLPFESIWYI